MALCDFCTNWALTTPAGTPRSMKRPHGEDDGGGGKDDIEDARAFDRSRRRLFPSGGGSLRGSLRPSSAYTPLRGQAPRRRGVGSFSSATASTAGQGVAALSALDQPAGAASATVRDAAASRLRTDGMHGGGGSDADDDDDDDDEAKALFLASVRHGDVLSPSVAAAARGRGQPAAGWARASLVTPPRPSAALSAAAPEAPDAPASSGVLSSPLTLPLAQRPSPDEEEGLLDDSRRGVNGDVVGGGFDRSRALAESQVLASAVQRGFQAALAVWSHADESPSRPCAWSCALSVRLASGAAHGPQTCFRKTCMVCVRPSSYTYSGLFSPSPHLQVTSSRPGTCGLSSRDCRQQPVPWSAASRWDHAKGGGVCNGCFLPRTVRSLDDTALDTHPIGRFGPSRCPWLLVIKVVLLQVAQARAPMSRAQPHFAPALSRACRVEWQTAAADGHGSQVGDERTRALSACERTIPRELLDWGPRELPSDVDKVAQWLAGGSRLPNVVLFAPILARAFGLRF